MSKPKRVTQSPGGRYPIQNVSIPSKKALNFKGMKGGEAQGGLHYAAWSAAASTRRLDPLLSAPSCDMAVGKDVCLSLPERETTEIVMCVPSLVPSLATQIKSSSLLFSSSIKWGIRRQQVVVSSHRTEEEAQKA